MPRTIASPIFDIPTPYASRSDAASLAAAFHAATDQHLGSVPDGDYTVSDAAYLASLTIPTDAECERLATSYERANALHDGAAYDLRDAPSVTTDQPPAFFAPLPLARTGERAFARHICEADLCATCYARAQYLRDCRITSRITAVAIAALVIAGTYLTYISLI